MEKKKPSRYLLISLIRLNFSTCLYKRIVFFSSLRTYKYSGRIVANIFFFHSFLVQILSSVSSDLLVFSFHLQSYYNTTKPCVLLPLFIRRKFIITVSHRIKTFELLRGWPCLSRRLARRIVPTTHLHSLYTYAQKGDVQSIVETKKSSTNA